MPWNPLISGTFYRRGITEAWGRGTLKMAELTLAAGLPRPEIEEIPGCVVVRFRPTRYVPPERWSRRLTERQREILSALAGQDGGLALGDLTGRLDLAKSPWLVRDDLDLLRGLGLVRSRGRGRGARWELQRTAVE